MTIFKQIKDLLNQQDINNILITGGGIIPQEDMVELNKLGIGKLFGPGTPIQDTIDYIEHTVDNYRKCNDE